MTNEKNVFAGEYFQVTTEERNGRVYERIYMRPGISVIPITEDGRIRCVRERRWDTGLVQTKLVTGYIDPGEDPLVCAKRELSEEIGVTAKSWTLHFCAESEGAINKKQYYFLARDLIVGQAHPEGGEEIECFVDLSFEEVHRAVCAGEFGAGNTAFTLLRLLISGEDFLPKSK